MEVLLKRRSLTRKQRTTLEALRHSVHDKATFVALTVLLLLDGNMLPDKIATILGITEDAVLGYWHQFEQRGMQLFEDGLTSAGKEPSLDGDDQLTRNWDKPDFLRLFDSIVLEHLDDSELDVKFICKKVGLSTTQLHRRLTALTGLSTGRYIYSIRLREARVRLMSSQSSVAEIAYQTGFKDPAYFTRLFTREFGNPPSFYRNDKKV